MALIPDSADDRMTLNSAGSMKRVNGSATGNSGDRNSASAREARSARITAPQAMRGTPFRTIMRALVPPTGTKMAWQGSAIATSGSASPWRCGTSVIPFSRSVYSA